jgi:RNA polymerase sigma-70 factor (ECF subfamily)
VLSTSTGSESELIAQAQHGDRSAFGELARRHYTSVISVVYRVCGDPQLAEDAAQEAFIRAWLNLPTYQPRASLRNWLFRIATNVALDLLRRERHLAPDDLEDLHLADSNPDPETAQGQIEQTALVQQAVLALPPASRAVLVLREYEGLSYQEIAAALDIPVGTVMSRLSYARSLLRQKLEALLSPLEESHV